MPRPDRRAIVDRVEGTVVVLETDDGPIEVPRAWLPAGTGEGSVLMVGIDRDPRTSRITLTLDPDAQAEREAGLRRLRDSIPEGPDGDLAL